MSTISSKPFQVMLGILERKKILTCYRNKNIIQYNEYRNSENNSWQDT